MRMIAKTSAERQADYRKRKVEEQKLREVRGVHVPAADHDTFKADMQLRAVKLARRRAKEQPK